MTKFVPHHKRLSLLISDHIASQFKFSLNATDMAVKQTLFQSFRKEQSNISLIAIFNHREHKILLVFDSKLIYSLANKSVGGSGTIDTKPKPMFTMLEKFMAEQLIQFIKKHLIKLIEPLEFVRLEESFDHVHAFYNEEKIIQVEMKCHEHEQHLGNIQILYPIAVYKKGEVNAPKKTNA